MENKRFDITGMTCSACSSRVDKAVTALDGIGEVSVNLLKNSMSVSFDPSITGTQAIIDAVEKRVTARLFMPQNLLATPQPAGKRAILPTPKNTPCKSG